MLAVYGRVSFWALPLFALFVALGVVLSSFCESRKRQWRVTALVLSFTLIFALWIIFSLNKSETDTLPPFIDTAGTVTDVRAWGRMYAISIMTREGGFVLKEPFASMTDGARVRLKGIPIPFKGEQPKSDFREDRFWRARGMRANLKPTELTVIQASDEILNIHDYRWRLYRLISIYTPRLTGAYLNATWTGKRDEQLNASHRRWGTSHLLAISGFHVGIVMSALSYFVGHNKKRVPILSLALWFYVILAGASASALRAALMIQVALIGRLFGRLSSLINSVCVAAVLLLLWSPFQFWDIGWRLSVLAAMTVAAVMERSKRGDPSWLIWLILNPLIWIATFAQVTKTFEFTPLAGVLINFAALPFFAFALPFASALSVLCMLGFPFADLASRALEGAFVLWGYLADFVTYALPWQIEWSEWGAYACAAVFLAVVCRSIFIPWLNTVILASFGALAAFALFG
ncbi:hypothetical protein AGMMS50276_10750 [Synergistales bacterium]|nr:hypothetical protein AGMMS50276_10750 [Synergistales bacterium]